jgi:hypothetical protein
MKTLHISTHFEIGFGIVFVYATLAYTKMKKIESVMTHQTVVSNKGPRPFALY